MVHSFALGVSILSLWCTLPLAFLFPIGWCPLTPSVSSTLVRRSPISWTSPSSVSVSPIGFPYLWVFPFPLLSLSHGCFNPIPLPVVWFPITFAFISLRCYFYCSWLFQQYIHVELLFGIHYPLFLSGAPTKYLKTKRPNYKISGDITSQVPNVQSNDIQNIKRPTHRRISATKCPKLQTPQL
jgi:hypothetical protein